MSMATTMQHPSPPTPFAPPAPPARTAASRLLGLLAAFGSGDGAHTLSELSRRADLSLTTTHRLLQELLAWGGADVDETGRYRLSSKFLALTSGSTRALRLRERALPHLMDLQRRTGLCVQLAARDEDCVMYLESLRPRTDASIQNRMGARLPLHATAAGLVLLAGAGDADLADYLSRPARRYTPYTPVDPAELRERLAAVRRQRYAIASRTVTLQSGSVAAPVVGPDGDVLAAVTVLFDARRHEVRDLAHATLATAGRISRALTARSVD